MNVHRPFSHGKNISVASPLWFSLYSFSSKDGVAKDSSLVGSLFAQIQENNEYLSVIQILGKKNKKVLNLPRASKVSRRKIHMYAHESLYICIVWLH